MDEQSPIGNNHQNKDDEKAFLQKIINNNLKQERSSRRWKIFFRLAYLSIIIFVVASISQIPQQGISEFSKTQEHTALIQLRGIILDGAPASARTISKILQEAFENENAKGIILHINSPGGSPVQSAEINQKIYDLRKTYPDKPIYAVVSDICASGAYYIAVATNAIYANQSSLVGSIGVIYDGFGFVDMMEKLGIERRVLTAGKNKTLLDPFAPQKDTDKQHLQSLLNKLHQHFITTVKKGRKDKLSNNADIFSGLIWDGEDALKLGLIDDYGNIDKISEMIGNTKIVEYVDHLSILDHLAQKMSTGIKHFIWEQSLTNTPR